MKMKWVPNKSLGSFSLGENIAPLIKRFGLILDTKADEDGTSWDRYKLPGKECYIDVDAKSGELMALSTYESCEFNGTNVIGLTVQELEELLNVEADEVDEPIEFDDGELHIARTYSELGLQAWFTSGKAYLASISDYTD